MNIRRLSEFAGIIMAIALIMTILYHLVNTIPPEGALKESQAVAIFEDASCITCHLKNTTPSFYSDLFLVGRIVENNRQKGYHTFDIKDTWEKMINGKAINEVHLAKIEMEIVTLGTMPPAKYYLFHWGSSITAAKKSIIKNWIKYHRDKFFHNELSSEQFKYEPIRPIPSFLHVNKRKSSLGEKLFNEKRLSADNTISCASCHNLKNGGANNRQYPESINKRLCGMNTQTIFNTYFNALQSWNGNTTDMCEYIGKHVLNQNIMGNNSFSYIINKLKSDDDISDSFNKIYEDGITESTITDAINEFVKTLITPDSNFDKYTKGDDNAINKMQIFGYELFKSYRCATCHAGVNLGGQTRELMGRYKNYFEDRRWEITKEDMGYFNHTADEYDRHRFKVPGLRNVELTKPYFHDGSQQTLHEAVQTMGIYQSGCKISDEDANAIVSFLETLTGDFK